MTTTESPADATRTTAAPVAVVWLALVALGCGIVHVALALEAPPALAVGFAILAFAEMLWAVVVLARGGPVFPRVAMCVAVAPLLVWSLIVVADTLVDAAGSFEALPFGPLLATAAFELAAAVLLGWQLRRPLGGAWTGASGSEPPASATDVEKRPRRSRSTWRYLVGVGAGALLVGGLVVPALAATEAGAGASTRGGHGTGTEHHDGR